MYHLLVVAEWTVEQCVKGLDRLPLGPWASLWLSAAHLELKIYCKIFKSIIWIDFHVNLIDFHVNLISFHIEIDWLSYDWLIFKSIIWIDFHVHLISFHIEIDLISYDWLIFNSIIGSISMSIWSKSIDFHMINFQINNWIDFHVNLCNFQIEIDWFSWLINLYIFNWYNGLIWLITYVQMVLLLHKFSFHLFLYFWSCNEHLIFVGITLEYLLVLTLIIVLPNE